VEFGFLILSILKMSAILAWVCGLIWVLDRPGAALKGAGIVAAFALIQVAVGAPLGGRTILDDFDMGLLFQACTMAMVALGLNLIYGFNGQFSLAQWGFYGIGAYAAADITFRWTNGDATGLLVLGSGVVLGGVALLGVHRVRPPKRGGGRRAGVAR
jgi:branched-chain amino acid transport system permease protein